MCKLVHYLQAPKTDFVASLFYCVSNWGGYEMEVHQDGEWARVRATFGDKVSPRPRWQRIKWTNEEESRPFVTFGGRRMMIDNFMRCY